MRVTTHGRQLPAEFTVIPEGPNKTKLRVVQDGFPCDKAPDDFYAACEVGWRETFGAIRRYLESR